MQSIEWLQSFFGDNCDGYWEHDYGVEITSTDNPGWDVRINLSETKFQDMVFPSVKEERTPRDWIMIGKVEAILVGNGGPSNLAELLAKMTGMLGNS